MSPHRPIYEAALSDAASDLLAALEAALPVLRSHATEEARGNRAPTGLPKRTAALERLRAAEAAIAKATKTE